MVTPTQILIVLSIAVFLVAGGGSLIKPAFAQAREDLSSIRTGVSQTVQDIRNKTEAGKTGESVG